MRGKDQTVSHIQDMEGSNKDTNPGARDIIPDIRVGPKDIRITKQYSNAF
jgi:hypothetical protein